MNRVSERFMGWFTVAALLIAILFIWVGIILKSKKTIHLNPTPAAPYVESRPPISPCTNDCKG